MIMNNINYKPRIMDQKLKEYLNSFGAVAVEGPKWCGKTWTSEHAAQSEIKIGSPVGNFQNKKMAEMNPLLALEGEEPRLIDEWQEVPAIWDAVREKVDEDRGKGKYILTGSSTPRRKGIMHSGAGRIGRVRMETMSLYEMGASSGKASLNDICHDHCTDVFTGDVDIDDLASYIIAGGWPESVGRPLKQSSLVPEQYIEAILDDDVYRLDGKKRDVDKMRRLLRSLARNESTTVSNKTLKRDIKEIDQDDVDENTVAEYLDVFDRLFLLEDQEPFDSSVRSSVRVKQMKKRHFCDPSLACALMRIKSTKQLIGDLQTFGFLFEALVEHDLRIYAEANDGRLYHYQDYANKEIDAVVECSDGKWAAFEVKLGANEIDTGAENLLSIAEKFREDKKSRQPSALCVICGLSNAIYRRPDGVIVVPITALKP